MQQHVNQLATKNQSPSQSTGFSDQNQSLILTPQHANKPSLHKPKNSLQSYDPEYMSHINSWYSASVSKHIANVIWIISCEPQSSSLNHLVHRMIRQRRITQNADTTVNAFYKLQGVALLYANSRQHTVEGHSPERTEVNIWRRSSAGATS